IPSSHHPLAHSSCERLPSPSDHVYSGSPVSLPRNYTITHLGLSSPVPSNGPSNAGAILLLVVNMVSSAFSVIPVTCIPIPRPTSWSPHMMDSVQGLSIAR